MDENGWLFKKHLPDASNAYCYGLWHRHQFQIKLSPPRKSKLGDYRYHPERGTHLITINNDLNKFAFLLVYLHEVAHYFTNIKHGARVKPHGVQWQQEIKSLLEPLISNIELPDDLVMALRTYLLAPKAANCSDPYLTGVLRRYDPPTGEVPLEQIPDGRQFLFRSRKYTKIHMRRTRVSCLEAGSHRRWLISKLALVLPLND